MRWVAVAICVLSCLGSLSGQPSPSDSASSGPSSPATTGSPASASSSNELDSTLARLDELSRMLEDGTARSLEDWKALSTELSWLKAKLSAMSSSLERCESFLASSAGDLEAAIGRIRSLQRKILLLEVAAIAGWLATFLLAGIMVFN